MPKITKRVVDAAAADPAGKDVFVWDAELKGYGLKVTPTGAKSYVLQYRTAAGRSRRYTIGRHGSPWTADDARGKASSLLRGLDAGIDPLEKKAEARAAVTVKELVEIYLKDGPEAKPNKKASSWATDRSIFNRHIIPLLGNRVAQSLTDSDVQRFQADVAAGKTALVEKTKKQGKAVVKGGKGIAARSLAVLAAMLAFGVKRKLVTENPAVGVPPYQGRKMERFLSEAEVMAFADAMATMKAEGRLSDTMSNALRLLMLTGCRKGEIRTLRWDSIDWNRGVLKLDAKRGQKEIRLGAPALQYLDQLSRRATSPFVLASSRIDGPISDVNKAWARVRNRAHEIARKGAIDAGEPEGRAPNLKNVRPHDLRHSFASFAVSDGQTIPIIGKLLGHTQIRTTMIYAHLHDDPLKAAADRTSERIAAAYERGAGQARPSAEVVEIAKVKKKKA